jgi:hypothetical protein
VGFSHRPLSAGVKRFDARYVLGYQYRDFPGLLGQPWLVAKPGTRVLAKRFEIGSRVRVQRDMGPSVVGIAPLQPDFRDTETRVAGAYKRLCALPPRINRRVLRRFRSFVRIWLRKHLVPLKNDTDFSIESWLSETKYTESRKEELRRAYAAHLGSKDRSCKSFIKREDYPEPKHARWINSRSDAFKVFSGPYFHLVAPSS